jgi:hypothetical protein
MKNSRKNIRCAALSLICCAFTIGAPQHASFAAESQTTLAISIRTLSSPYQVMYKEGAEAYAKEVGLPLDVLTTEGNSQKGLTDIKAEVARTGGNVAELCPFARLRRDAKRELRLLRAILMLMRGRGLKHMVISRTGH